MKIEKLQTQDLDVVLEVLRQDTLRYCDGNYPERGWVGHFITDENCFAFGMFSKDRKILLGVLLAEKLTYNGCMLWYIAVTGKEQGNGYGSQLLSHFEQYTKSIGVEWIFLNATTNSLKFYAKHNYLTSEFSKVIEHVKDF